MHPSRILLVDDDRLILGTLSRGLEESGYIVRESASGEEAIAVASDPSVAIDLAIVDVSMPGMSGLELAGVLKTEFGIATLILSAYSDTDIVKTAVGQGVVGYLVKPVDVPQMIPAVEAGLARARELKSLSHSNVQLEQAVQRSRKISTALGITMCHYRCSEKAAFDMLRSQARSRQMRMEDLAEQVVAAVETLNGLGGKP